MLLTILFYIFFAVIAIQLFFYVFLFGKFSFVKQKKINSSCISVSIIIAAKNEAENLKKNLPLILNQEYPTFEVVLVNDASSDKSLQIMQSFKEIYSNIKIVTTDATATYTGNKKNALSKGIEAATYNYLLFTDADCKPISKSWIAEMVSGFTTTKKIILGYGGYQKIKNSFLNKLIRYETLLTALQYFSYAKIGIPYMGVGRNLGYKKELYSKNNGFENHKHIKSGDDDLLINEIATENNTAICFAKESFTISNPKTTFQAWFQQKRRHISTSNSYKPIHQLLLSVFYLSQFLFWCLAIILLIFSFNWLIVTILVLIRLTTQYIIITSSALKLNEKDLIFLAPIFDFFLVFTQLFLFITNLISKPKYW